MKKYFIAVSLAAILCCTACVQLPQGTKIPSTQPTVQATDTAEPQITSKLPEGLPGMESIRPSNVSTTPSTEDIMSDSHFKTKNSDYTISWWPNGVTGSVRDFYIRSGNYGLSLCTDKGYINHIGYINDGLSYDDAIGTENNVIASLPELSMDYNVSIAGVKYPYRGIEPLYQKDGAYISSRILETGRYMQHHDLQTLRFSGTSVPGHLEVSCTPEYFGIGFGIYPDAATSDVIMSFSVTFKESFSFEQNESALAINFADGGITFVNEGLIAEVNGNTVTFTEKAPVSCKANDFTHITVTAIPSKKASLDDGKKITELSEVTISAQSDERNQPVKLIKENGYFSVYQLGLKSAYDMAGQSEMTNETNRTRITISNDSDTELRVPLQFYTPSINSPMQIPVIRAEDGQPIGLPVQTTVNFHAHEGLPASSPKTYYQGLWLRYYTYVTLKAGQTLSFIYDTVPSNWGGVPAVGHEQICLVGWGGYQQWEHTLGTGSICYDIQRGWNGAVMADAYPVLTASSDATGWSTNSGGGDFLFYYSNDGKRISLASAKTQFRQGGPCFTETKYKGLTSDGKVMVEITINADRDNSYVSNIHSFKYTFLEDVETSRIALYQCGADSYTYDRWLKMAVGNANGVTGIQIGNKYLEGTFDVPGKSYDGYVTDPEGVNLGKNPWVALMDTSESKSMADRIMAVTSFSADIDGKHYDTPNISLRSTNINGRSAIAEINLPQGVGKNIPAGSVVECVVNYILFPVSKSVYVGNSSVIASIPDEMFDTAELAYLIATQTATHVTAKSGTVVRDYPALVHSEGVQQGVAAQFTVSGGMGYIPVSISGLPAANDWVLQKNCGGEWLDIKQSDNNDFWQCLYDAASDSYEITFNVEHTGRNDVCEYRLIHK